jgi:adenine-specific DNA-methyltransferase
MARIDDLIGEIPDKALRIRLQREIADIKKEKKFGLVFEQHLPELVPMYEAPIRRGARVAERSKDFSRTYLVKGIRNGLAICTVEGGSDACEIPVADLVVVKRFGEPIFPTLRLAESITRGNDSPHNVLIEADNYHALQLLEWLYPQRIDCIYIDPPYNTGARDWKYNNDYVDKADAWRHSKWLAMMRRRLIIARRLLKPEGVLIVTIAEREVFHLGMLLEEVFRGYLRHMVTDVVNPKGTGKHNFARVDEYVIFCVPDLAKSIIQGLPTSVPVVGVGAVDSLIEEEDDEEEDGDEEMGDDDELEDAALETPPFPEDETDLWELRHARRRGGESSYRHQRPNQFYALWVDPNKNSVVRASPMLPMPEEPSLGSNRLLKNL